MRQLHIKWRHCVHVLYFRWQFLCNCNLVICLVWNNPFWWLENSDIEIRDAALIPLTFNHLNWNPSKNKRSVFTTRLNWPLTQHVLYINNKGSHIDAVNISDNGRLIIQLFPAVEKRNENQSYHGVEISSHVIIKRSPKCSRHALRHNISKLSIQTY